MVRITEDLVRRRSEHNDGILHSLQELTLHQFEIERIEALGTLCRHLRILYLQNNLIGKLENLHRLKELDYLNVAVNNITLIENLDRCESLRKLDLTLNFIDVDRLQESCENLRRCPNIRELYLMGNPCTSFGNWRRFVIGKIPQLESLDAQEIAKSERILAKQQMAAMQQELDLLVDQKRNNEADAEGSPSTTWHSPEARTKMYHDIAATRKQREEDDKSTAMFEPAADPIAVANKLLSVPAVELEGRLPSQRNQGKWEFRIDDDDPRYVIATVNVPRFLDTSQIRIDIHPRWFQCVIKGKLILLHLPDEVASDDAIAQRVITTGALVLKMPRAVPLKSKTKQGPVSQALRGTIANAPTPSKTVDFRNIVEATERRKQQIRESIDESEVPPLE